MCNIVLQILKIVGVHLKQNQVLAFLFLLIIFSKILPLVTRCCCISCTASEVPLAKESVSTVTLEFATSICSIWSLTGITSFELGLTVNSITVETHYLMFEIEAIFKDVKVT